MSPPMRAGGAAVSGIDIGLAVAAAVVGVALLVSVLMISG